MTFVQGKKVKHKFTNEWLWMLKQGNEQILCRTKDLREVWFYPYELTELDDMQVQETKTILKSSNRFL